MRETMIVAYDISDNKRLRQIFIKLRGYGNPLQHSVFICVLSPKEKALMISELDKIINYKEDSLIIVNIGYGDSKAEKKIEIFGKSIDITERGALIV
jgi:CRISPR-associated protein Cas2